MKYNLTLLAIFKNEEMSIDLWLRHYIWMGVEHFFLIDNGSTDKTVEIANKYGKDKVTVISMPEPYKQVEHYNTVYFSQKIPELSKWCVIADLDEFWYCPKSTLYNELNKLDENVVLVTSGWRMFGSNGLKEQPPDIRVSITLREPELHQNKKCIFRTSHVNKKGQIKIHEIDLPPSTNNKILENSDIFRLNHYPIQSWEYFSKTKIGRSDVASSNYNNHRDEAYFKKYDENANTVDEDLKNMVLENEKSSTEGFTGFDDYIFWWSKYWIIILFSIFFIAFGWFYVVGGRVGRRNKKLFLFNFHRG